MNLFLYLAGMLVFTSGFYFVKKSDSTWNGVCNIFFSYMVWMLVQSLACGINIRLENQVIAWQYGVLGILLGSLLWIKVLREKCHQKYEYAWIDFLVAGLLMVSVVMWGKYQFGSALENYNFASVHDSARHLYFARHLTEDFNRSEYAAVQYFSAANTAAWMDAMKGILTEFDRYKVFICCELLVFWMNGIVFWMAIRRFLTQGSVTVVGVIVTFLYLFGHPCNSLVYGTAYLSTGIMLAILIYYIASLMVHQEIKKFWGIALLVLSEIGLLRSYKMLLPIFLCGTVLYLYYFGRIRDKKMTSKRLCFACIVWGILAIAGMICLFAFNADLNIEADLVWEMYGHLYADYLFLLPFLIILFIICWKKKSIGLEETLLLLNICFVIAMLLGLLNDKVSTYYFYKSYITLWGLAFLCVVKCFRLLKHKEFPTAVFISWVLLFAINMSGVDSTLYQKNDKFKKSESAYFFPIYTANVSLVERMEERKALNELIMETARMAYEEDVKIPYVSIHASKDNWSPVGEEKNLYIKYSVRYHVLSGQPCDWTTVSQEALTAEELREEEYPYALVICDYRHTKCIEEELKELKPVKVIKRTEYGCLLAIQAD